MMNHKVIIFTMTLIVLVIGITAVSATDVNNNTVTDNVISDNSVSSQASDVSNIASDTSDNKAIKSESKIVKQENKVVDKSISVDKKVKTNKTDVKSTTNTKNIKTADSISVNNDNFDTYFTSNGLTDEVSDGANINFESNITRNGTGYLVNKPVNLYGNGYTIYLNTTSGSYFGNETGSAFIIGANSNGTNVTGLNFYNTQLFIRNTSYVVADNISSVVSNQRIGSGVGTVSVRDNANYVTVKNSYFYTENNGGSSTFVIAGAQHCVFDNNTIMGNGNVGNLVYLTTYNIYSMDINDPEVAKDINSYNNITNNHIYHPGASSGIRYGIAIMGHDNLILNNTIENKGYGIQAQYGTDATNYVNNSYINNTVLEGASTTICPNSTVIGNKFSGSVTARQGSVFENNTISTNGSTTFQGNITAKNNTISNTVSITASNVTLEENILNSVKVSNNLNDVVINNNTIYGSISGSYTGTNRIGTKLTITVTNNPVPTSEEANIIIKLVNSTGSAVENAEIDITIDDTTAKVTTNSTGEAIYKYSKNDDGYIEITAEYKGNDQYTNSSSTAQYKVGKFDTSITVPEYTVWTAGNDVIINGTLTDENNNAISGVTITITVNDVEYTATTDDNGNYYCTLPITQVGEYEAIVTYAGNDTYYSSTQLVNFDIETLGTYIEIEDTIDATPNSNCEISGNLYDSATDKPIANADITVTIDGVSEVYTAKTDSNGTFTATITTPSEIDEYTVRVNYAGNITYDAADEATATLNVNKLYSTLTVNDYEVVTVGDDITINGTLYYVDTPIVGATVTIKVNDEEYTTTTDADGKYSYAVPTTQAGTYDVEVVYAGNDTYYGSDAETFFDAETLGTYIELTDDIDAIVNSNCVVSGKVYQLFSDKPVANAKVTITIDGVSGEYTAETDSNGTFTATITTPSELGEYTVRVNYAGNITYDAADEATATLNVNKLDTTITVNDYFVVVVGNDATINGTLTNANNEAISGVTVTIKVNDAEYTVTTDADGKYSYAVPTTQAGTYDVEVVYAGNDSNYGASATTFFDAETLDTYLEVDNITDLSVENNSFVVSGKLYELYSEKPIANANIIITVDGVSGEYTAKTDSNGTFTATITTPTEADLYVVRVNYAGNATYDAAEEVTTTVSVLKLDTTLTVNDPNFVVIVGDDVTINGTLTDANNKTISGATITVTVNDENQTVTTDSEGKYTYTFKPSELGTYNVVVNYAGNEKYYLTQATTFFDVEQLGASIVVDEIDDVTPGSTFKITGSVTEWSTGSAVTTGTVKITVDGIDQIFTPTLDNNGKYSVEVTAPSTLGSYGVNVEYTGSPRYSDDSDETEFNVIKYTSVLTVDTIDDVTPGSTFDITGSLTDESGNPITEGTVYVAIDGTSVIYPVNVDANGNYEVTVTAPENVGTFNVNVTYGGSDVYDSVTKQTTLTVNKATPIVKVDAVTGTYKDNITFTATVTDSNGNAITGGKVVFKVNGITIRDAQGNVMYANVVNGVAQITTTLPYNPRDYVLNVVYSGDSTYNSVRTNSTLTIKLRNADMTVTAPSNAKAGDTVTLKATVTYNNQAVENGKVVFKLNGKTIRDAQGNPIYATVTNGVAQMDYTIPDGMSAKEYTVTAVYGNTGYARAEAQTDLTVTKTSTYIETNPVTTTKGQNATVTGTIKDANGNTVTGTTSIAIKINGKTVKNTKVTNGTINVEIPTDTLNNKQYTITVVAGENNAYSSSRTTQILTIN